MASSAGWVGDPDIDAAFDELLRAQVVAYGGVGIANTRGPATQAFYKIRAAGPAHLERILGLLDQATPAGRVYAASLLTAIDASTGRSAWERLATEDDTFEAQRGCTVFEERLSQYALEQLTKLGVHNAAGPETAEYAITVVDPIDIPTKTHSIDPAPFPSVDSVAARQEIIAAFHGEPRVVFVIASDEQQFVECLFPEVKPPSAVYVCRESSNGDVRGPHFDLYQAVVHPDYPFVATLNLAGDAAVESTVLDRRLAAYYFTHYPQSTETADTARRLVSELMLSQQREMLDDARISAGVGMVIPQREFALPVVHEVRPDAAPGTAGLFLKFIVPRPDTDSLAYVEELGFSRWQPGTDSNDPPGVQQVPNGPQPVD